MAIRLPAAAVAPRLLAQHHAVRRAMLEQTLSRKIALRPEPDEVMEQHAAESASERAQAREQLENALNSHLASKYSTRWSAGASNEAAPLLSSWGWRREHSSSNSLSALAAGEESDAGARPGRNRAAPRRWREWLTC